MTRFVWITVLVALVLLTGADKVSCPDGCTAPTGNASSTESHDTVHMCVLCVLGVEMPTVAALLDSLGNVSTVQSGLPSLIRPGTALAVEHPPRPL